MMTFDDGGAILRLGGILARMANMQPVMAEIGIDQRSEVQDRLIHGKEGPEHEHWDAWAPMTRAERQAKGNVPQGLLWDSGALIQSILSKPSGESVEIGTDIPYAADLQFGHPAPQPMSGRPFLGWSEEGQLRAEHMVVRYLEGINA